MRSPETKDWADKRSIGRREADRGVCLYHDMCHETVADIKQGCLNHLEANKQEFDKLEDTIKTVGKSKLDSWVFKLLVGSMISVLIFMGSLAIPQVFKLVETITTISVNQKHLLQEFGIKPVKK